ncbi:MAG: bacteriorhodopsin-like [Oceanicaulis sp.]
MEDVTLFQYNLVYNALSFTLATFAAATLFFWLQRSQVGPNYKLALTISGLVTFIAAYHYFRMYESWTQTFEVADGAIALTGEAYNRAYRYVDWFLTVPLLVIELILVMRLSQSETIKKGALLGGAAALMILLGYPGEVQDEINTARFVWGALSMIPFLYIVYSLVVGLSKSIDEQPEAVKGLVSTARWIIIATWSFYPVVYFLPFIIPMDSGAAFATVEIGYTIADITAKAVFGLIIYVIAVRKAEAEGEAATVKASG